MFKANICYFNGNQCNIIYKNKYSMILNNWKLFMQLNDLFYDALEHIFKSLGLREHLIFLKTNRKINSLQTSTSMQDSVPNDIITVDLIENVLNPIWPNANKHIIWSHLKNLFTDNHLICNLRIMGS